MTDLRLDNKTNKQKTIALVISHNNIGYISWDNKKVLETSINGQR